MRQRALKKRANSRRLKPAFPPIRRGGLAMNQGAKNDALLPSPLVWSAQAHGASAQRPARMPLTPSPIISPCHSDRPCFCACLACIMEIQMNGEHGYWIRTQQNRAGCTLASWKDIWETAFSGIRKDFLNDFSHPCQGKKIFFHAMRNFVGQFEPFSLFIFARGQKLKMASLVVGVYFF